MKNRLFSGIWSLSGASLFIGVTGFISAIVSMFIDVNEQISVKWLILTFLISFSLILILLKVIFDLSNEKNPAPPFENPIMYAKDEQVFVIKRNDNFLNSILVGCYYQKNENELDRLAYLAAVHIVQDKVIQIKILVDLEVIETIPTSFDELKTIFVRPVIPVTALKHYYNMESINE
jgi:hypothetical protein